MFKLRKKDNKSAGTDNGSAVALSFTRRLRAGLGKTRQALLADIRHLFGGGNSLDELMDALETRLIMADAGIEATGEIMRALRKNCRDETQLLDRLQQVLTGKLLPHELPLDMDNLPRPAVILVIGVNGVGKTTTIGKLAHRYQLAGYEVMLAAGDVFRAAAVEQLQAWGKRNNIPVIAQAGGTDAASVAYDALAAARARGIDILLIDTAGRLHNKRNLMNELVKIKRVLSRLESEAPHETLLVLDAGTGQNAVSQTASFHQATGVTGLVLTKLDGTAKGGVLFNLARQFALPVRFIGVGEQPDDLRDFSATEFVSALLDTDPTIS